MSSVLAIFPSCLIMCFSTMSTRLLSSGRAYPFLLWSVYLCCSQSTSSACAVAAVSSNMRRGQSAPRPPVECWSSYSWRSVCKWIYLFSLSLSPLSLLLFAYIFPACTITSLAHTCYFNLENDVSFISEHSVSPVGPCPHPIG